MEMKACEYLANSLIQVPQGHHLNPLLLAYLQESDFLAGQMGGAVVSRQVVALAIATFRRIFQDEPVFLKDPPQPGK